MALPRKPIPEVRSPAICRVGWGAAAVLAAVALAASAVIGLYRAPLVRLAGRFELLPERLPYAALRQRIAHQDSSAYQRLVALSYAAEMLEVQAGKTGDPQELIALINDAARTDPANAAFELLKIDAALRNADSSIDALSQFAAIEPHVRAAAGAKIDFGVSTERALWETAIREETNDEVQAVLEARRIARAAYLGRQRALHERMLSLSSRLAQRGALAEAAVCCAAVIGWAGAAIESVSDIDEAQFWADASAEAYGRLSLLEAQTGRAVGARAARDAEQRCRRFRHALLVRLSSEPVNYLEPVGSGWATTARRGPYLAMTSYLAVSGIALAGAAAALGAGVAALMLCALFALKGPRETVPVVLLRHAVWSWIGVGTLVAVPSLLASTAVLAVPIDPAQLQVHLGAGGWLEDLCVLAAVGTIVAVLTAGRLVAARVNPIRSGAALWRAVGTLAVLGVIAVLWRQWALFGEHPIWFERSWQRTVALARLGELRTLLLALVAVAAGLWLIARTVRRVRGVKQETGTAARRYATFKTVAVVSILGWACSACLAAGSVRLYYEYEGAFRRLAAGDARDEVAARLGPRWRDFLPEGEPLLRGHLSRLANRTDE